MRASSFTVGTRSTASATCGSKTSDAVERVRNLRLEDFGRGGTRPYPLGSVHTLIPFSD